MISSFAQKSLGVAIEFGGTQGNHAMLRTRDCLFFDEKIHGFVETLMDQDDYQRLSTAGMRIELEQDWDSDFYRDLDDYDVSQRNLQSR